MKVQPAVFFAKSSGLVITALLCTPFLMQAQSPPPAGSGLAPGAIQQPYYRQPGSAYVPPGTAPRASQPSRQAAQPAAPQGYQPGFGTAPSRTTSTYKPPTVKGSTPTKAKTSGTSSKSKPATLETKVARLERNDAHQDRRLNNLEHGSGSHTIEGGGLYTQPEGKFYTVRPGDTLWRIADRHSTSINAIKSANRIFGETITIGQTLVIPGHSSSASLEPGLGSAHIVRPGDTFSEIAHAYGVSQDSLARANPSAYPDRLLIGEKLVIPGKKAAAPPAYPAPSGHTTTSSSRTHLVQKGESLGAIAKSYGIPTLTLASANKIKNANLITPGQRLIIPGTRSNRAPDPAPYYPPADSDTVPLPGAGMLAAPTPPPAPAPTPEPAYQPVSKPTPPASTNSRGIVAYRLERGDDINTVSALFNTTPDKIRELNKLPQGSKLKEGDEVVVPSLGAVSLN